MKKIKIISIAAAVIIMMTGQSCKKYFEGVNETPDYPTSVTPRVLLPGAEGSLAYSQGGDVARHTAIFSGYIRGGTRQFFGFDQYVNTEEDFNNVWNNLYAGTMENFQVIMDIEAANPGLYTTYDAIAKILMAYTMGMSTDLWGDVPFEEAFKGNLNLTPAYDTQEDIYANIQQLLDEAITALTNEPGDDADVPDANDFIYGGDAGSWIALAHALKARHYIHLTGVDGNAAANALASIDNGGPVETAAFPFNTSVSGQSPWFQYIDQRDDISYSSTYSDLYGLVDLSGNTLTPAIEPFMVGRDDPRWPVYNDINGDFGHWDVGYLGPFFQAEDAQIYFMTEHERKFIEAEARFLTGDAGGAQTAFTEAIQASMDFYGVDGTAYIASFGTLNAGTELQQIITEKWVANFLQYESWTDWRRTGFPTELVSNVPGGEIPRRFIYPTNERLYNTQAINQNSTLYAPRVWWDQ